jgi:hypothetical protein
MQSTPSRTAAAEVTITADGQPIGRVFATSGSLAADALTELEMF